MEDKNVTYSYLTNEHKYGNIVILEDKILHMTISIKTTIITIITATAIAFFGMSATALADGPLGKYGSMIAVTGTATAIQTNGIQTPGNLNTNLVATQGGTRQVVANPGANNNLGSLQATRKNATVKKPNLTNNQLNGTYTNGTGVVNPNLINNKLNTTFTNHTGTINSNFTATPPNSGGNNGGSSGGSSSGGGSIAVRDVATYGATNITKNSVTLHGEYDGFGSVEYKFEYGTTSSMTEDTSWKNGASGFNIDAEIDIDTLESNSTYYYRLVVESRGVMKKGKTETFTTDKQPVPVTPAITYAPPAPTYTAPAPTVDPAPTQLIADVDVERNPNAAFVGTAGTGISLVGILISAVLLLLIMIIGRKIIAEGKKNKLEESQPEEAYGFRY